MSFEETEIILDKLLKILNDMENNPSTDLDLTIAQQGLYDIADSKYSSFIEDHIYSPDEEIVEDFRLLGISEKSLIFKFLECCVGFMKKCVDEDKPVFYERFLHFVSLLEIFRID